jgi:O6-methylguanine-DNA--protein-cysteine methyltransferase
MSGETATVVLQTSIGPLGVVATRGGLRRVLLPGRALEADAETRGEAGERAQDAAAQLEEYLAGERQAFDVEVDWDGVDERHRNVLETLVAADGLGGYGGGLELKRRLLELEHVLPPRLLDL